MVRTQKQGAIFVIMFSSVLLEIEIHFQSPLQILHVSFFDKQVSSAWWSVTRRILRTDLWERMELNPLEVSSPAQDLGQDARRVRHRRLVQRDVLMRFNFYINPSSTWHVFSLLTSHPCQDITLEIIEGCWLRFKTAFSSKDQEILPFPWAAATLFCFGIELRILGDKRKMIQGLYWSMGEFGATEGLWEQPNPSLLSDRAAGGPKPSPGDVTSSGQPPSTPMTAPMSPCSSGPDLLQSPCHAKLGWGTTSLTRSVPPPAVTVLSHT